MILQHRYSPSTIVMMRNVIIIVLLAFVIYVKYFQDELVGENVQNAIVLEVLQPSGDGVASHYTSVKVQLDDGAKANTMLRMSVPAVGQSINVKVRTYESGSRNISAIEF